MKAMSPSKKLSQRAHAKRRFIERTGTTLSKALRRDLVRRIQDGKATFLDKQSNRVSLWKVPELTGDHVLVYDKRTHEIVTVLPLEDLCSTRE